MKNKILTPGFLFVLFMAPVLMHGQSLSASAFFNNESLPATYLGIDFTLAKLINDDASNARTIQLTQFNGINDLMVTENKKYDIQEAYHRSNWTTDTKEVESRNDKANPDQLKSSNEADLTRLKPDDIDNLVKNFNYGTLKGYGVLLIMEGMSKTDKRCTIWFTLVDIDSKKVLTTARVEGKLGSGFGFRNYWASAIKNAISHVKSKDYEQWKTGAGSK
ncbi:MAG TPA: hypothetical protein VGZ90_15280 [Puia sp.]|jgi:hypothetical protein|nr:hypothetical protein [Puia sp.]